MTETLTAPARTAALSRELSEFLVEFSIGVHRYVMYPPGHPSLAPVVETLVARLADIFDDRRSLSIGVAQRQLIIQGVATDTKHPVLSDLALRLHGHQLGALKLDFGITAHEIDGLMVALATESERGGTPLGLLPPDELPQWEHATLHRVGYERLELSGEEAIAPVESGWADELWRGLAQATLGGDDSGPSDVDGKGLAQGMEARKGQEQYEQVIAGYLRQIPHEIGSRKGAESERLRKKVADFIGNMDEGTLSRLVSYGSPQERQQFLLDANQSLAVDSVVKVLKAAADAENQTISHSMTRLLSKLAMHAVEGGGPQQSQADTALRENVEDLIEGWSLGDPNPDEYTNVLDHMARATPLFQAADTEGDRVTGARRIVEMALEVDAYGPIVAKAVEDYMEEGGAGFMMELVRAAPPGNQTAKTVLDTLVDPAHFRHVLLGGRVDDEGLWKLLDQMGTAAVEPLLDVLSEAQDRAVRRRVFDAVLRLGPVVGERAVARLQGAPWFVQRNMLALLERVEAIPPDFDPQAFLSHRDPRVRRQAFPLALARGPHDRVLAAALVDPDERMNRLGIGAIEGEMSAGVLPTLVNRVIRSADRPEEVRTAAIRALSMAQSPLALRTLLDLTTSGKTLFGKTKLPPPSPEVLAALRVLAVSWADHEEAREVLEQAARAKDPDIRGAVRVTSSSTRRGGRS